jgi:tyrosinase
MTPHRPLSLTLILSLVLTLTAACGGGAPGPGEPTTPQDGGAGTPSPEEPMEEKQYVRPNMKDLAPDGPEIAAYRKGVAEMMSRPASDPTSWLYQANIHGTYDVPALEAWNTCQHGSWFFFSWHRMYVYYFERILREASGDPDFALPFWDYTDPTQRALPLPLRQPQTGNPLFVTERNPGDGPGQGINDGAQLPASATSFSQAMMFTNFSSPEGSGLSFGGQQVPAPVHFSSPPGQLESQPHNVIHNLVGGPTGWMSDPNLAARDPAFWLHHANIDRLWNVWKALGDGREDPSEGEWRDQIFVFFDETGQRVELTGKEVVDSAAQLHYTYAAGSGDEPALEAARESFPAAPFTDDRRTVVVDKAAATRLRGTRARVSLEVPAASPQEAGEEGRLALVLEGVSFGRPGIYYEVYANLPEGAAGDPESPLYIGNLAFFGQVPDAPAGSHVHPDKVDLAYEITGVIEHLREQSGWAGGLDLHFVPRGLEPPEGQAALEAAPAAPEVRFERVKVIRE